MPITLLFWEWGCPKRGDAHITVTAQCPPHVERDTRRVKTAVESLYTKITNLWCFFYPVPIQLFVDFSVYCSNLVPNAPSLRTWNGLPPPPPPPRVV